MKRGKAFILSAPAGTGKTTLVHRLVDSCPNTVKNISYTTRKPRENEKDGVDYHFISFQEFERKINKGQFLEYAEVFGHFYGTSHESIEKLLGQGKNVMLVIDTQGALALRPSFKGVYIFMSPPSMEELERRLDQRQTECEESLKKRLNWAHNEMECAVHYDYHIVNQDLDETYSILKSIILAEKFRIKS
jgi:guanylate kinase